MNKFLGLDLESWPSQLTFYEYAVGMHISNEARMTGNATKSAEEPNQAWHPRKNRLEAGPGERQINRGLRQGCPHQQFNSSPRNQGTTSRWQSGQSTIDRMI